MTREELITLAAAMRSAGASIDAVLAALRAEGATAVDSIVVVRAVEAVRLGVAKEIVDKSPVWADWLEANGTLRQAAYEALGLEDE